MKLVVCSVLSLVCLSAALVKAADITIDWDKAKALYQRSQNGEQLSPEDQKYLDEAKRQRRAQQEGNGTPSKEGRGGGDMAKARSLMEKKQRGETLTAEEEKYLEEIKHRMNGEGGGEERGNGEKPPFNIAKAKAIMQKKQGGEPVTPEEEKYLEDAKRYFTNRGGARPGQGPGRGEGQRNATLSGDVKPSEQSKGLVPLTELTGDYHGRDGGLYGGGKNEPPSSQEALATKAIAQIKPLNAAGQPDPNGKIVMMSLGMSNTTMEFSAFMQQVKSDGRKAADLVIVDGAQGGRTAMRWATADAEPWKIAENRIAQAGATPQQVQVLWIKQANAQPRGGTDTEIQNLQSDVQNDILVAKQKYPNLRLVFLSSRIYAGFAQTALNPEPYAYEGAFAMRGVILKQMSGDDALNADPSKGEVKAPVVLWGPYLWAAGTTPRKADGLTYVPTDFGGDGTHPSASGREKVAKQLLEFFTTDRHAKPWFTKN